MTCIVELSVNELWFVSHIQKGFHEWIILNLYDKNIL
jgi:hypothetical protein